MRPQRILIFTQYYPPEMGAAQTRLLAFAKELKKQNLEVEVVTAMPNYPESRIQSGYRGVFYKFELWEGIPVHRTWIYASQGKGLGRLLNYFSFCLTSIWGLFRAKKPDILYVNSGPLFLGIPARVYCFLVNVPYIFNVSDLWPRSVGHLKGLGAKGAIQLALLLEAWCYRGALFVNGITEGVCEILVREKKIARERLLYLPNGVDLDVFSPALSRGVVTKKSLRIEGKFVFIYPGNHGYAHALDTLVRAAEKLGQDSGIHILLVGGGSEKERLRGLARDLGVTNLSFYGPVPPSELVDFIALADVGLIHVRNTPLAEETRPAKMFPLMAMEKPILYAGFGEGRKILLDCGGGESLDPENPELLAQKMIAFKRKSDSDLRAMGQRNRKLILSDFSTTSLVSSWLEELDQRWKG